MAGGLLLMGAVGQLFQDPAQLEVITQEGGKGGADGCRVNAPLVELPAAQQHADSQIIETNPFPWQPHLALMDQRHRRQQHGVGRQFVQLPSDHGALEISRGGVGLANGVAL